MDKKKKRKRIMCMSLACMLVFSNVSTAYANPLLLLLGGEVARNVAMVGVASLLGLTGVGVTGYIYENQDVYSEFGEKLRDDFVDFCSDTAEWGGITASKIARWLDMFAEGTLDKGSEIYLAFKDYVCDLSGRTGSIGGATGYLELDGKEVYNALKKINYDSLSNNLYTSTFCDYNYAEISGQTNYPNGTTADTKVCTSDFGYEKLVWVQYTDTANLVVVSGQYSDEKVEAGSSWAYGGLSLSRTGTSWNPTYYLENTRMNVNSIPYKNTTEIESCPNFGGCYIVTGNNPIITHYQGETIINVNTTRKEALQKYINLPGYIADLIIASGCVNAFSEWEFTGNAKDTFIDECVIDKGIEQVIDRDGTLDNVDVITRDGVRDSVIPVDWDNVQAIDKPYVLPGIVSVDDVDGVVIGSDIPVEDVPTLEPDTPVTSVPQQTGYTVGGLETVFPFCIPFDLVKIFTLFKAEPTAPKFNYTFTYYVSGNKKTKNIDIDLSKFNTVAELLRTVELIAFMVALTLKTRDLIRG